jgi:hypothetical protein
LLEDVGHDPLVAGVQAVQAVAHDDPVGRPLAPLGTLYLLPPNHLGVLTGADDAPAFRVDAGQDVEIDKAVVERGDQGIGPGVTESRERAVTARRVDDDDLEGRDQALDQVAQAFLLFDPGGAPVGIGALPQAPVLGHGKIPMMTLGVGAPVLDIAG